MLFRQTEEFIYSSDEYHDFISKQEDLNSAGIRFTTNITASSMTIRCSTEWVEIPQNKK